MPTIEPMPRRLGRPPVGQRSIPASTTLSGQTYDDLCALARILRADVAAVIRDAVKAHIARAKHQGILPFQY
jgi:hypothetical protein